MPSATSIVLDWLRRNAGPDGKITIDRETLERAGMPERFVRRLSARLHELQARRRIVLEGKSRVGKLIRYTVAIPDMPSAQPPAKPELREKATLPVQPAQPSTLDLRLRLSGGKGTIVVEELSVSVSGANGGSDLSGVSAGQNEAAALRAVIEKYERQGAQLVANALKMQEVVQTLQEQLEQVRRIRSEVEDLRTRIMELEAVVHIVTPGRHVGKEQARIPRIFAEDAG